MPKRGKKKYFADIDWKDFQGQELVLPICVRSPAVRGRSFETSLKEISGKVSKVYVQMCDTLDRYNLDVRDPEREALQQADAWLEKSIPIIGQYIPNFEIKRWNDVRADKEFAPKLSLLTHLYRENYLVKKVVDNIADYYLRAKKERCKREGLIFNERYERQKSTAYLIEEFAGTSTYNRWYGLPEAYWGVYVGDPQIFNKLNTINPDIDLSLPETLPIYLNRLEEPQAGEFGERIKQAA